MVLAKLPNDNAIKGNFTLRTKRSQRRSKHMSLAMRNNFPIPLYATLNSLRLKFYLFDLCKFTYKRTE